MDQIKPYQEIFNWKFKNKNFMVKNKAWEKLDKNWLAYMFYNKRLAIGCSKGLIARFPVGRGITVRDAPILKKAMTSMGLS